MYLRLLKLMGMFPQLLPSLPPPYKGLHAGNSVYPPFFSLPPQRFFAPSFPFTPMPVFFPLQNYLSFPWTKKDK